MKTLILAAALIAGIAATGVTAQAAGFDGKSFFDTVNGRTGQ